MASRSEIVDGNDLEAVHFAAQDAVDRARDGAGPTLIEAKTMRMLGHAIHDGAEYVPPDLLAKWEARDPITLYEGQLLVGDIVDGQYLRRFPNNVAEKSSRQLWRRRRLLNGLTPRQWKKGSTHHE